MSNYLMVEDLYSVLSGISGVISSYTGYNMQYDHCVAFEYNKYKIIIEPYGCLLTIYSNSSPYITPNLTYEQLSDPQFNIETWLLDAIKYVN